VTRKRFKKKKKKADVPASLQRVEASVVTARTSHKEGKSKKWKRRSDTLLFCSTRE